MKKYLLLAATAILFATAVTAQSKDTVKKDESKRDTVKTHIIYIAYGATGETKSCWAERVEISSMQFVNPTAEELKQESVTLKKQRVLTDFYYLVEEPYTETVDKKKVVKTKKVEYPKQFIVFDSQRNREDLLKAVIHDTIKPKQ